MTAWVFFLFCLKPKTEKMTVAIPAGRAKKSINEMFMIVSTLFAKMASSHPKTMVVSSAPIAKSSFGVSKVFNTRPKSFFSFLGVGQQLSFFCWAGGVAEECGVVEVVEELEECGFSAEYECECGGSFDSCAKPQLLQKLELSGSFVLHFLQFIFLFPFSKCIIICIV